MSESRIMACVGAGNVGRAWAIVFARAGWQVRLYDADPSAVATRALPMIRRSLQDMRAAGMLNEDVATVEARLHAASSIEEAVRDVSYVQESAREDAQVKAELFGVM